MDRTDPITQITYRSGPYDVKGYLCRPAGVHPEIARKWPALVYCRGGIRSVGKVRLEWVRAFAARGFVVLAPSYRGNEGGGGTDEFGGADCEDTCAAARLLRDLPFVDSTRVSVMGFSRGSVNAFRTAILEPWIHRLVLWGGVSDLADTYDERPDLRRMLRRILKGAPNQVPAAYRERSAVWHAASIPCPTLLVHGTADVQVAISHSLKLRKALLAAGRPVDWHLYEGYGHHLPDLVFDAVVDRWLEWISSE
ncbi:MAG: prolyl oligopeptidase family serine peptidase [Firmicutes bacterium]|nr:prolyl oligopeptidase family serine peptidase [Bacillota bacterium]